MTFGELVKYYREKSGMSQRKFAECVGSSLNHLRAIENGEARLPSALMVAQMVEELGLTPFEAIKLLKALSEDAERAKKPSRLGAI